MKRFLIGVVSLSLIAGCATVDHNYRPVIDSAGTNPAQMEKDLAECRQFAQQRLDAQQGAMAGAIAGAVLGIALGAIVGLDGRDLARAAGAGALGGTVGGANDANRDQKSIVANCMAHRGYRVLGY